MTRPARDDREQLHRDGGRLRILLAAPRPHNERHVLAASKSEDAANEILHRNGWPITVVIALVTGMILPPNIRTNPLAILAWMPTSWTDFVEVASKLRDMPMVFTPGLRINMICTCLLRDPGHRSALGSAAAHRSHAVCAATAAIVTTAEASPTRVFGARRSRLFTTSPVQGMRHERQYVYCVDGSHPELVGRLYPRQPRLRSLLCRRACTAVPKCRVGRAAAPH